MEDILRTDAQKGKETLVILDTSVAINSKAGTIAVFSVIEHPPCENRDFDVLFPELSDYARAIEIASKLRSNGTPIGAIDILIAAMCINRSATLLTKDRDFAFVKNV